MIAAFQSSYLPELCSVVETGPLPSRRMHLVYHGAPTVLAHVFGAINRQVGLPQLRCPKNGRYRHGTVFLA